MRRAMLQLVIFDGRNLYRPERMKQSGFTYYSIRRPAVQSRCLGAVLKPDAAGPLRSARRDLHIARPTGQAAPEWGSAGRCTNARYLAPRHDLRRLPGMAAMALAQALRELDDRQVRKQAACTGKLD